MCTHEVCSDETRINFAQRTRNHIHSTQVLSSLHLAHRPTSSPPCLPPPPPRPRIHAPPQRSASPNNRASLLSLLPRSAGIVQGAPRCPLFPLAAFSSLLDFFSPHPSILLLLLLLLPALRLSTRLHTHLHILLERRTWAWEKTVVMLKQPGHLTSMKKELGL